MQISNSRGLQNSEQLEILYDPVHAALPWAGVQPLVQVCSLWFHITRHRMLVGNPGQVALSYKECMEVLLIGVERIGKVLVQCAVSARLFCRSGLLIGHSLADLLVELYLAVYEFFAFAKRYSDKSRAGLFPILLVTRYKTLREDTHSYAMQTMIFDGLLGGNSGWETRLQQ